jgi:hypothetical protein
MNSNLPSGAENDPRAPFNEQEEKLCVYCNFVEIEERAAKQMVEKYGEDWQEIKQAIKEYDNLCNPDTRCDECELDLINEFKND